MGDMVHPEQTLTFMPVVFESQGCNTETFAHFEHFTQSLPPHLPRKPLKLPVFSISK